MKKRVFVVLLTTIGLFGYSGYRAANYLNSLQSSSQNLEQSAPSTHPDTARPETDHQRSSKKGDASISDESVESGPGSAPPNANASKRTSSKTRTVNRGDTIVEILQDEGVEIAEALTAGRAFLSAMDAPLRPGDELEIVTRSSQEGVDLIAIKARSAPLEITKVQNSPNGEWGKSLSPIPHSTSITRSSGNVQGNLIKSANEAGIPTQIILMAVSVLANKIDLQREIHPGDEFEVAFEELTETETGEKHTGRLRYIKFDGRQADMEAFAFDNDSGTNFYSPNGESIRSGLIATPVDGARLSSNFGMREHPILGYSRMHEGVDFAAPRGTPVYAAGDGRVEFAGRNGGYGNFIRIKHNRTYKSTYAHLYKFAKGLREGTRIKQGQVIAYVGTSGSSTGPHLHYEVLKGGSPINPMKMDLPPRHILTGKARERFIAMKSTIGQGTQHASSVQAGN